MNPAKTAATAGPISDDFSPAEGHLAKVLILLQRAVPRLEEPARASDVQNLLRKAAASLEAARQAHEEDMAARAKAGPPMGNGSVTAETVAIISAAVTAVLNRPYRLVAVQPLPSGVPHLNVWALEGRTQIFQSHKIR